jgi:hypothetical protein
MTAWKVLEHLAENRRIARAPAASPLDHRYSR